MSFNYQVEEATIIVPTERFGNITVKIKGLETLGQVYELRDSIRKRELEDIINCGHLFPDERVAKSGKKYRVCIACGAISFQQGEGWTGWKLPTRGEATE